jgi:quinohemoprotein ethanol dehydrogenase
MNKLLIGGAAVVLAVAGFAYNAWQAPAHKITHAGKDWVTVHGDWANTRYSTLDQINTTTVKNLGGAWFHKFEGESSYVNPVIGNGKMFITAGAKIYALDPKTGQTVWIHKPSAPAHGLYKGVALGEGLVFAGLSNAHIVAIKQDTGEQVWQGLIGDERGPVTGAASMGGGTMTAGQLISAGPTYVDGLVISGLAIGDYGVQGRVVALDAKTGKQVWRFNTVPDAGEAGAETWPADRSTWQPGGGGGVWMNGAVDPDLGLIYFGVGNPVPQWGGEARKGDNLYTSSVIALDIKTGKLKWHFQVTRHDLWEAELGAPLILFEPEFEGKKRKAVAVMHTYGYIFVLDRETGKPVYPVEDRPVPQNPRVFTAATQPFPVGADQMGSRCTPEELIPAGFKALCQFDPIDHDMPNGMYPMMTTRVAPMAYNPDTKYFYATGANWFSWIKRTQDPKFYMILPQVPGMKFEGLLAAFDSRTNKLVWQKKVPYRTQHNGSGFTTTKGGLLFHGNTDGLLDAYDAKSGDLLWQFQTGFDANQPVALYEVDGEQHVGLVTKGGVWAFKLGGTVPPLEAPRVPATESSFSGRVVETSQISVGATVRDSGWVEKVRETFDAYAFQPVRAKVKLEGKDGAKVTWTNTGKEPHSIAAQDGSWRTGEIAPGKSVTLSFKSAGTFTYICNEHPWSYGQLIVEE